MTNIINPAAYEAWYHTSRGSWVGEKESLILLKLLRPVHGQTLLDVGSGTGYFSRRFTTAGLNVTGIDADAAMARYARTKAETVSYIEGVAEQLPFADNSFDYTAAVTSLCFVSQPLTALTEMWRVSRHGVVLGLLNRHSLLYLQKHDTGSYQGARWDRWLTVRQWIEQLTPPVAAYSYKTAIFFPKGGVIARTAERLLGENLSWGGFLAVYVEKQGRCQACLL